MTRIDNNNPVVQAEVVTEPTLEEVEEATDYLKESSAPSIMMSTDDSRDRKTPIVLKRSSRTRTTVTRMAMNVPMIMIVRIVCGQKRITNRVQRQRI